MFISTSKSNALAEQQTQLRACMPRHPAANSTSIPKPQGRSRASCMYNETVPTAYHWGPNACLCHHSQCSLCCHPAPLYPQHRLPPLLPPLSCPEPARLCFVHPLTACLPAPHQPPASPPPAVKTGKQKETTAVGVMLMDRCMRCRC